MVQARITNLPNKMIIQVSALPVLLLILSAKDSASKTVDHTTTPGYSESTLTKLLSGVENSTNEANSSNVFHEQLFQATLDVTSLHRPGRSVYEQISGPYLDTIPFPGVPRLNVGPNIMHSSSYDSKDINRNDVWVESLLEEPVLEEQAGVRWLHKRFNNTDYLLAILPNHLVLWVTHFDHIRPFDLRLTNSFLIPGTENAQVSDCLLYSQKTSFKEEKLYLSVASVRNGNSFIHVYRLEESKVSEVTHYKFDEPVVKLSFLDSLHSGGTVFALVSSPPLSQEISIAFHYNDAQCNLKVLKVSIPSPVNFLSFMHNGHVFVAVSNDTACYISKLDSDYESYAIFDIVYAHDIVDLALFKLGSSLYLIVASQNQQDVLVLETNRFQNIQQLAVTSLSGLFVFYSGSCHDDALVVFTRNTPHHGVFLYHFIYNMLVPVPSQFLPETFNPLVGSMTSFQFSHTTFLVMVDKSYQTRIFSLRMRMTPRIDPVFGRGHQLVQIMDDLDNRLKHQESLASQYFHIMDQKVDHFVPPLILADQEFTTIHVLAQTSVSDHSNKGGTVTWDGSKLTRADFQYGLDELEQEMKALEENLRMLELELNDAVLLNTSSIITGHKNFQGKVTSPELQFDSLTMPYVAGKDTGTVMGEIYRLDRPRVITGIMTLKGPLGLAGSVDASYVNGLVLSKDVLSTTATQEITETVNFNSHLHIRGNVGYSKTRPFINEIALDQLATVRSQQMVSTVLNFKQKVRVQQSLNSPFIDGVDMSQLMEKSLTRSHQQVLEISTLPVYLQSPASRISQLHVQGRFNNVDLGRLADKLSNPFLNRPFGNPLMLDKPVFQGGLFVKGRYDGVSFPDSLFRLGTDQFVTAPKVFEKVTAGLVDVRGRVDGADLLADRMPLNYNNLPVPNDLIFDGGLDIDGDLTASGLIDAFDLHVLNDLLTTQLNHKVINAVFVGTVIIERHLKIAKASPADLKMLEDDLIFPDDHLIEFTGRKRLGSIKAPSMDVKGMLSGYNLHEDFMHVSKDQIIGGRKTMEKPVVFGRHLVSGNNVIGGINIVDLYHNRLSLYDESTLYGSLSCLDMVTVDAELIVRGKLDTLQIPNDIVVLGSDRVVEWAYKTLLDGLSLKDLNIDGNLQVTQTLDGVHLEDFLRRRVTLTGHHNMIGSFMLGRGNSAARIESVYVNDMNLQRFISSILTSSQPQIVQAGPTLLPGSVNIYGNLKTSSGINSLRLDQFETNVIKLTGSSLNFPPGASMSFTDALTVKGGITSPFVNGVDLLDYNRNALKKSGGVLRGTNIFLGGVQVNGNADCARVNGAHLEQTLLLKTRDQTISGYYHFKELFAESKFDPLQPLNDIDIFELQRRVVRVDRPNIVTGNVRFVRPLTVSGNLDPMGLVNGIKISNIHSEAVFQHTYESEQRLMGTKIITGPIHVKGDIDVGFVNNYDLKESVSNMVWITSSPVSLVIEAPKTFSAPVTFTRGTVEIKGHLNVTGRVDGVDLKRWVKELVFLDRPSRSNGIITLDGNGFVSGSIIVKGKINNLNLAQEALFQNTDAPQTITGLKTFSEVWAATEIEVGGLINQRYHLPQLVQDTLTIHGDQRVIGIKHTQGLTVFEKVVHGLVNGFDLSHETISLHAENLYLKGNYNFKDGLSVMGNLETSGLVCQVDVPKLTKMAIYKELDTTVLGDIVFSDVVLHQNVLVKGHVTGIDLNTLQSSLLAFKDITRHKLEVLKTHFREMDEVNKYLEEAARHSTREIQDFKLTQILELDGQVVNGAGSQVEILDKNSALTFNLDNTDQFSLLETYLSESSRNSLLDTAVVNGLFFQLWLDDSGSAILSGVGGPPMLNFSLVVDGALRSLNDRILLVALLRVNQVQLIAFELIESKQLVEVNNQLIPITDGGFSIDLLNVASPFYVTINFGTPDWELICLDYSSPISSSYLSIYIWDIATWAITFLQQIYGAGQHLGHFTMHPYDYILKAERYIERDVPKLGNMKLFKHQISGKGSRPNLFHLVSTFDFPAALDFVLFQEPFSSSNRPYLASVNATHIWLGRWSGAAGFKSSAVVASPNSYSIRALQSSNKLETILAVGPSMNRLGKVENGVKGVRIFKISWAGLSPEPHLQSSHQS